MTKILAVALLTAALTAALTANATVYQATDKSGTTVSLHAEGCTNQGALQLLPKLNAMLEQAGMPEVQNLGSTLRAAEVLYQGKAYGACWTPVGNFVVVLDDGGEDTSIFVVPARDFTAAQAI